MSKELPYFRFTASEWLTDDINLESYELKGLFADVCSYYWVQDCSTTKAKLEKRFSNAKDMLSELLKLGLIKQNSDGETVSISFLDKQYDLLSDKRQKHVEAGRLGGLKKFSKAKAKLKHSSSYKDKDKDKDKELVFPFTSEKFLKTWGLWIEYRKERKFPEYKPIGLQAALNMLGRYNEETVCKMIMNSIEQNYQGIFELKNNNNSTGTNKSKAEILKDYDEIQEKNERTD